MRIPCYMFDCAARLRPAAFFDLAQQMAAEGAERLGFSDEVLGAHGMVWILARMKVRFDSLPERGDEVLESTWHRGMNSLFFIRDYRLDFPDGSPAVRSTSSWVVMQKSTRRLSRPEALEGIVPAAPEKEDRATGQDAGRIVIPKGLSSSKVMEHKVVYSDLDYNGHVNNARYVVWALDALPAELTMHRAVEELSINYNREATPGDTVELFTGEDDGIHYIEGRIPQGQSFICTVTFR